MTRAQIAETLEELFELGLVDFHGETGEACFTLTAKGWSEHLSDHDSEGAAEATPTRALPRLGRASRATAAD